MGWGEITNSFWMAENKRVCLGLFHPTCVCQRVVWGHPRDGRWAVEYSLPKTSPKGNPKNTFGQFVAGYMIVFLQKNRKDSLTTANGKDTQQIQQQFVELILFEALMDCRNEPGWTLWILSVTQLQCQVIMVGTNAGFPEKSEWIYPFW